MATTQTDSMEDDFEILSESSHMTSSITEKDQFETQEKLNNSEIDGHSKVVESKQELEWELAQKNNGNEKHDEPKSSKIEDNFNKNDTDTKARGKANEPTSANDTKEHAHQEVFDVIFICNQNECI